MLSDMAGPQLAVPGGTDWYKKRTESEWTTIRSVAEGLVWGLWRGFAPQRLRFVLDLAVREPAETSRAELHSHGPSR